MITPRQRAVAAEVLEERAQRLRRAMASDKAMGKVPGAAREARFEGLAEACEAGARVLRVELVFP